MTYFADYEYNERYFVRFQDIEGNDWRISIQDPQWDNEEPEAELAGAEFPIEWEGDGDESQEKVMCGTTGRIRLICLDTQSELFKVGKILPTAINNRRVQVLRYTQEYGGWLWKLYWQGFIKPDVYTQEWDSAPYTIELPIVSLVASLEYFPMPLPLEGTVMEEQTNVIGLIRAICIMTGCDIKRIFTNMPVYEDFNGEKHLIPKPGTDPEEKYEANWSQGVANASYFYDFEDGFMQPKTFRDVMENICYPYGKVYDTYKGISILMRWKNDAIEGAKLYDIPIWYDYDNRIPSSVVRFRDYSDINIVNLTDVLTAGTDNTFSQISAPRSATFKKSKEDNNTIFEMSDKYISPALPIGDTLVGKPTVEDSVDEINGVRRYLYAIPNNYINKDFAENWNFENVLHPSLKDYAFCRVVDVTGNNESNTAAVLMPLGFSFNINGDGNDDDSALVEFTLVRGVRSVEGMNAVRLAIKPYVIFIAGPAAEYHYATPIPVHVHYIRLFIGIQDMATGRYYDSDSKSWGNVSTLSQVSSLPQESGDWILSFNEDRQSGDNTLHRLRLSFYAEIDYDEDDRPHTYGMMFCSFKMEYSKPQVATNQGIAAVFAESILANGNTIVYNSSGGENIEIEYKTLCGSKNGVINGSVLMPWNSFCNSPRYIDSGIRKRIDIDAATFTRYRPGIDYFDFVDDYVVVKDGQDVFLPVAVGMNPRMNTIKLRLVSTNVTKQI